MRMRQWCVDRMRAACVPVCVCGGGVWLDLYALYYAAFSPQISSACGGKMERTEVDKKAAQLEDVISSREAIT